jgi:uncharacterized protein (UPF0332 family)
MLENVTQIIELSNFHIEKATKCLQSAEKTFADDDFDTAANRSYYSIFHSMKAILTFDEFDSKNHGEIIGKFRKDYIKSGIFPVELSQIIRDAFDTRNECDYEDFYFVSKSKVSVQIENARKFLDAIKEYTTNRIKQEQISR